MQVQEKKIKGFNLLELVVVVVIIGIISAVAYPNFSSWSKERKTRLAAVKITDLITGINLQVKRGLYAYVQVHFKDDGKKLTVTSKGMNIDNLSSRINNNASKWNATPSERCLENDDDAKGEDYWDDVAPSAGKTEVRQIILDDVATTFKEDVGVVCFSKSGNYFNANGTLASGTEKLPDEFIFICTRTTSSSSCKVDGDGDADEGSVYAEKKKFLFSIGWTRFGDVSLEKWSQKMVITMVDDKEVEQPSEGKWIPL